MKKFLLSIAIISLPVLVFCQCTTGCYYSSETKTAENISVNNDKAVQISPNPGNGQFHVLFAKNHDIYTSMIAYDNAGRVVYEKEHLNGNPVSVDLSHLQSGIYFVVLMANNRMERITKTVSIVK